MPLSVGRFPRLRIGEVRLREGAKVMELGRESVRRVVRVSCITTLRCSGSIAESVNWRGSLTVRASLSCRVSRGEVVEQDVEEGGRGGDGGLSGNS